MANQIDSRQMSQAEVRIIFGWLLLSTLFFLYLTFGIWAAVPQTSPQNPAPEPDLSKQAGPEDGSPQIELIDPKTVMIATKRNTIRIFGYNFEKNSQVLFDGVSRKMNFVNQNQVVVELVNSDFFAPGTIVVSVANGDKTSNAKTLLIESAGDAVGTWSFFWIEVPISQALRLLLLATFIGAGGASIMALQSMGDYRGRSKLTKNWFTFYLVRPFVGGGVALVFYLVIRGGFLSGTDIDTGTTTPFGIVAVAALVGMFSDKAILKLSEVFLTLFKAEDDRGDKLTDLSIDTTTLPDATTGTLYSQRLTANGGKAPYKWSVVSLPAGLNLDPDTGIISGTPTAVTPKTAYTFTVEDASGATATVKLEFEVK
jgi:hypothetical protein